ncbi:glycosyl transferase family 2 [Chitinophaga caeni]|uniref:Glycosyl transferase family 2 n=1 Tax=Chitinophaga caeni TaxID=2029983 RepID=A0A291QTU2_9BACT|nr:glycosyltransferase [Chitinophaga caeni]ATL47331.1 glycosyl transferase family 2 [Chitinophaga caeni]
MLDNLGLIIFYCFAAVAGIQVLYYLFVFSRLAFYKRQFDESAKPEVPLSVIICAKNEEAVLPKTLPQVLGQRYLNGAGPEYEVIVVNDNSEDDTKYYLRSIEPAYAHFRHIEIKQSAKFIPGKKYPLSVGIKGAKHDTLVLTDADCKPSSTYWLSYMSQGFEGDKEIVLGYGPYYKKKGFLNKVIRYETFFSAMQYLSYAMSGMPYMGVGRNLAYKKDLFFKNKGFTTHQHIASGDDDLFINKVSNAKNTAVVIDKNAFAFSEPKDSWKTWFRQKTRHMSTGKHYKFGHKLMLGIFSLTHFLFYPLFIAAIFYPPMQQITLGILGGKLLIQGIIMFCGMKKLGEQDLFWYSWFLDIFMLLYYIIFTPALLFKAKSTWK